MKYLTLRKKISFNIFSLADVFKLFSRESQQLIKTQLSRFAKRGLITKIKRGWYCFETEKVDRFVLASILYRPSYLSLETALNFYGLIPDIPQEITSVTLTTTKTIKTEFGFFQYTKIKKTLFFGFSKNLDSVSGRYYNLASAEKALLDYFYLRRINNLAGLRISSGVIDKKEILKLSKSYPQWVRLLIPRLS